MAPPKAGDMKAGVMGLILGGIGIAAVVYTIVHLTNAKYERTEAHPAPAETR